MDIKKIIDERIGVIPAVDPVHSKNYIRRLSRQKLSSKFRLNIFMKTSSLYLVVLYQLCSDQVR